MDINSKITHPYQTIITPNTIIYGAFKTNEWYDLFSSKITVKDNTIFDIGCNTAAYGFYAVKDGCKLYTGIDNSIKRFTQFKIIIKEFDSVYKNKIKYIQDDIETYNTNQKYDITIFSMVIHWFNDPKKIIKKYVDLTNRYCIFLFRGQDIAGDGFRPTPKELHDIVQLPVLFQKDLSYTDQNIYMVIYDKNLG